jgi:hypothetical protein
MGMSLKQMYTQIGQFVQDTSSGRQTRIIDSINRQYRKLAEGEDWADLWRIEAAEVTVYAGVPYVFLPAHVDVMKKAVLDSNTDVLTTQDPSMFISRYYDTLGTSSNPYTLTPLGSSPVKRRISTAETLDLVSSDATDTSAVVEVWGMVSGEELNESVTLNGTTTVTTSNTFSRITRIGTSTSRADSSRVGNITITGTTSSLEYAVIKDHEFESRYQQFRAQDAPNTNDTLTIFYKKKVQALINDGDTLELDGDLAVIEFTIADILQQQGKYNQAQVHNNEGERLRLKMMSRYAMQSNTVIQSMPIGPGTNNSDRYGLYNKRISVNNG